MLENDHHENASASVYANTQSKFPLSPSEILKRISNIQNGFHGNYSEIDQSSARNESIFMHFPLPSINKNIDDLVTNLSVGEYKNGMMENNSVEIYNIYDSTGKRYKNNIFDRYT